MGEQVTQGLKRKNNKGINLVCTQKRIDLIMYTYLFS